MTIGIKPPTMAISSDFQGPSLRPWPSTRDSGGEAMSLTELPYHLPGRIFRSPMPFSVYDPQGDSLLQFKREKGSLIVLLAEEAECIERTGQKNF